MKNALLASAALGLCACGGGSDSGGTSPTDPVPTHPIQPGNALAWTYGAQIDISNGDSVRARTDNKVHKITVFKPETNDVNSITLRNAQHQLLKSALWTVKNPSGTTNTYTTLDFIVLPISEVGTYHVESCVSRSNTITKAYPFCAKLEIESVEPTVITPPPIIKSQTRTFSASDFVSGSNARFEQANFSTSSSRLSQNSNRGLVTVNAPRTEFTYEMFDEYDYLATGSSENVKIDAKVVSDTETKLVRFDLVINGADTQPTCHAANSTPIPATALTDETYTSINVGDCIAIGDQNLSETSGWKAYSRDSTTIQLTDLFRYAGVDFSDNVKVLYLQTTVTGKISFSKEIHGGDSDGDRSWKVNVTPANVAPPSVDNWQNKLSAQVQQIPTISATEPAQATEWIYHWRVYDETFGKSLTTAVSTKTPELNLDKFLTSKNLSVELYVDNRNFTKHVSFPPGAKGELKKYELDLTVRGDEPQPPKAIVLFNGKRYEAQARPHSIRLDKSMGAVFDGSQSVYSTQDPYLSFHHIQNSSDIHNTNRFNGVVKTFDNLEDVNRYSFCIAGTFPWNSTENPCVNFIFYSAK
ncbi:hypothetical protein [Vibrio nigripulchritudo]|uniref:hypothetical protein n=1 Tax=Vibrio nigripulchritudo TaxID=28173 RepID=UPI00031CF354|nr:hypothetical protein [Vibrio nigripulchritudo]